MLLQIFKAILLTSVIGSVLAAILLLLKPITKRYFGSAWQYYAWAIVLVVMMFPITIKLPQSTHTLVPQTLQTPEMEKAVQHEEQPLQNEPIQTNNRSPFYNTVNTAKNISLGITDMFSYAWLTGCLIFLTLTIFRYFLFLRAIRKNSIIVSCPELGTNKIITRRTDMIDAPLMIGLFRPTLLLPDYEMTAENLNYILLHELTHYRRHDLFYKWFAMLVCTIHWFNPLVYIVLKQIDEECEISCDLSVVGNMDRQEQKKYMHTILAFITQTGNKQKLLTTAMANNKKQIRRRFIMIKNFKKLNKSILILSVLIAFCILTSTVFASGILTNAIGIFQNNEDHQNDTELSMKVKENNSKQLTLIITNNSENDYTYGEPFTLERKNGDTWETVNTISGEDPIFYSIAYILGAGQTREVTVNWEPLYGNLVAGEYRITKDGIVGTNGNTKKYYFSAEFSIQGQNNNYSFSSASPDKKVRIEFTEGENILKLVDVENDKILISYNYAPDTRFTAVWRADSYYVALGYKNKTESRTFILVAKNGEATTGKQIFSGELLNYTNSIHPENAETHIIPLKFIDNSKLLLSIDWIDAENNKNIVTTEWDFQYGTYTELEKQSN